MRDILESAEKSIHMVSSKHELMSKQKMFTEIFKKIKKREINVKIIVPEDKEEAKKLSKKFGVSIKSKSINSRFIISDKRELIFTINPTADVHEDFDHGIWINSGYFANSLAYMFELAWKN